MHHAADIKLFIQPPLCWCHNLLGESASVSSPYLPSSTTYGRDEQQSFLLVGCLSCHQNKSVTAL